MSQSLPVRTGRALLPWLVPLSLVLAWQAAAQAGLISHRVLPAPLEVLKAGAALTESGDIWSNLKISFWRVAVGFVIGLALGLATGVSRLAEGALDTTVQMLRNIPPLALIPLVILWFGIDEGAKVFLVAFGTVFPVYLNTYLGIRSIDPALIEMAKSYGLSGFGLFRHVLLPGALPSILMGARFALGIAWIILIVAETISSTSGIGYMAMNAREFLQTDVVVLSILLYALLGKATDMAARALERASLRWHPSYQAA
ncbi:ABC transporter permease subunit [Crenobacter sp. SG2303]|uniref:ABC transporter permease subunit n=1 Tax=Crenobacter oryzisoli TaxID=3056844 RepID=A0ABT7XK88_9NEIS|nr:ABC transporter permease subunit [Crenobacter sp. SG2303]MDN0074207.1 ABC transporter permease subunit [Crenobacter sp. SG2303]